MLLFVYSEIFFFLHNSFAYNFQKEIAMPGPYLDGKSLLLHCCHPFPLQLGLSMFLLAGEQLESPSPNEVKAMDYKPN